MRLESQVLNFSYHFALYSFLFWRLYLFSFCIVDISFYESNNIHGFIQEIQVGPTA